MSDRAQLLIYCLQNVRKEMSLLLGTDMIQHSHSFFPVPSLTPTLDKTSLRMGAGNRELPEMGNQAALQIFTAAAFCNHAPFPVDFKKTNS